jgi:uncharacterized cupredoxin-like copper-binding protein
VSIKAAPAARPRHIGTVAALAAIAAALVAAGCGSSSKSTSSAAPASTQASTASSTVAPAPAKSGLKLAANAEGLLRFDKTSLSTKAGRVSIEFTNSAAVEHNFTVASPSGAVLGATPTFTGGFRTLTLTLKPGTYTFYCSVPGHRAAGMEGKLTVN